jgi:hypothetical protein
MRVKAGGAVLGLGLGLLALGPGIQRGYLLTYDMLFVPNEPFSAALPGQGPPRGVPSDLVVAAASRVLPADVVQKVILLGIFTLACAGVVALLEDQPVLARLAAGTFYTWNPYIAERLIIGHWPQLLGYAGLPWVFRAATRQDLATRRGAVCLAGAMVPAIIGGVAAMAITGLVLVPVAAFGRSRERAAIIGAVLIAGSLPWLVPSLLHSYAVDPASVAAFAARPDTPFGSVGSLLMLGGIWNADTVPKAYGGWWSVLWLALVIAALAGFLSQARKQQGNRWAPLGTAAGLGLVIASIGITAPGRALLRNAIGAEPGFAIFRDAQQFVAPLALAEAIGLAAAVAWCLQPGRIQTRPDPAGPLLAAIALVAPILLIPGLLWGAAGRLRPAGYPASWLTAASQIDASPIAGTVIVLPWATYRTPAWNHGEVVIDPWFHLLSRPVIWNDGTQVGSTKLAPDDPRARALESKIDGTGPLTAALKTAGISFVVDDAEGQYPGIRQRLPGATIVIQEPGLTVYQFSG